MVNVVRGAAVFASPSVTGQLHRAKRLPFDVLPPSFENYGGTSRVKRLKTTRHTPATETAGKS
jgi:hypothetical protein